MLDNGQVALWKSFRLLRPGLKLAVREVRWVVCNDGMTGSLNLAAFWLCSPTFNFRQLFSEFLFLNCILVRLTFTIMEERFGWLLFNIQYMVEFYRIQYYRYSLKYNRCIPLYSTTNLIFFVPFFTLLFQPFFLIPLQTFWRET